MSNEVWGKSVAYSLGTTPSFGEMEENHRYLSKDCWISDFTMLCQVARFSYHVTAAIAAELTEK
jgi:hypothetical protein